MGSCHCQGYSVVSLVAVKSETGTKGTMMSRREGTGTPGSRKWEGANTLLFLDSTRAALSAWQSSDCETCLEISDLSRS